MREKYVSFRGNAAVTGPPLWFKYFTKTACWNQSASLITHYCLICQKILMTIKTMLQGKASSKVLRNASYFCIPGVIKLGL